MGAAPPKAATDYDVVVIGSGVGGYRTYYFGAMLAAYYKLKYDRESHFAAALIHDIGLTESRIAPLKQCCFAVSGGRQARDFLLDKHHPPAQAQVVGDAISAHLNLHVPAREYGEIASLVAKGAVCDLFGFEKRKLPESFKSELLRAYPAGDIRAALQSDKELATGSRLGPCGPCGRAGRRAIRRYE